MMSRIQLRVACAIALAALTAHAALATDTSDASDAAGAPDLVLAVLTGGIENAEQRCGYTRLRTRNGRSKLERFDPSGREGPWSLLAVDGRAPTRTELDRYVRKAPGRADRRHPLAFDLREMVEMDSWQRVGDDDAAARFTFRLRPYGEIDAKTAAKVLGTFAVDPARRQPKRIRLENEKTAYVGPFVKIKVFEQDMIFEWNDAVGAAVLVETRMKRRGSALGLKSLDRDQVTAYGDYRCAAPSA